MKNLTPHDIKVIVNGNTITFLKTGTVARVSVETKEIGKEFGIPREILSICYGISSLR